MSRNYSLPDRFERFIDDQVAVGRYASPTEVVEAGLQALQELQSLKVASVEDIKTIIQTARQSGRTVPASDVFDRIENRIREKLAAE